MTRRTSAWTIRNQSRSRDLRRIRIALGLCQDCGRQPRGERTRCVECRRDHNEATEMRRAARRAA